MCQWRSCDDDITGGAANDQLTGGMHRHVHLADTAANNGEDTISDFTTTDVLNLSAFVADDEPTATVADTATSEAATDR